MERPSCCLGRSTKSKVIILMVYTVSVMINSVTGSTKLEASGAGNTNPGSLATVTARSSHVGQDPVTITVNLRYVTHDLLHGDVILSICR